jgi:hypothetical protein
MRGTPARVHLDLRWLRCKSERVPPLGRLRRVQLGREVLSRKLRSLFQG